LVCASGCGAERCDARSCLATPSGALSERGGAEAWRHFVPQALSLAGRIFPLARVTVKTEEVQETRVLTCDEQGCWLLGLKWQQMSASERQARVPLTNPALASTLAARVHELGHDVPIELSIKELGALNVSGLSYKSYVEVAASAASPGLLFKPRATEAVTAATSLQYR